MLKKAIKEDTPISSYAKIVDGKLILSLPHAIEPVVWQMDLQTAQSAGFTVKEDKKKKETSFVLKKEAAQDEVIALFEEKEVAVGVLMETSEVLQSAQSRGSAASGSVVSMTSSGAPETSDKKGAMIAIALVIVLVVVWTISAMNSSSVEQIQGGASLASGTPTSGSSNSAGGVPISADEFLKNR